MRHYKIHTWDVAETNILPASGKTPVVYIKPDSALHTHLKKNLIVPISFKGTGALYDKIITHGTFVPSEEAIGYRPNFATQTGTIAVFIDCAWMSYPLHNGELLVDIPAPPTPVIPDPFPDPILPGGIDLNSLLLMVVIVLLIIILFKKMYRKKK